VKIHVIFTNRFESREVAEVDLRNCVCGVIDTIRAASTIATIIGRGGKEVIIAENKRQAFIFKKIFTDYILCGEEGGLPPKRFDYGNSPLEISKPDFKDKGFIIMTTNGTQSIFKTRECPAVFILSILNMSYTVDTIVDYAARNQKDIVLLCSGEKGKIAYDDVYTAGIAVKYLLTKPLRFEFSDSAKLAMTVALTDSDVVNALEKSSSANSLRKVCLGDDIEFCSQLNKFKIAAKLYILNSKNIKSEKTYRIYFKNKITKTTYNIDQLFVIRKYDANKVNSH
ncbi:MAG: 2-phosphosulfolactate phosphatase, partial [Actinobacteria bacterium]|nr:2-phosphosulfolactate phosphatase [Actinomycetota bacterium]